MPRPWVTVAQNTRSSTVTQHRRRVARSGVSQWATLNRTGTSAASLDSAVKDEQFALRICAVDLKNEPLAAGALIKIKTRLAGAKISVEVADIKVEPIRDRAKTTLQDIFVVAKLLPKAPKMIRLVCSGPPGARHLFDLDEIGRIPSKGAYPPRAKVAKLPFNGATFLPVALVRSALCLTEPHGAERAS